MCSFLCVTRWAGRWLGMSLACDHCGLGHVYYPLEGLRATLCFSSLFLEQTFPGRGGSYPDVCSGCWLWLLGNESLAYRDF